MIFDSISSLLPGLLPGMYRGISFHVPDTSSESGRRVVEYLFPGVDLAAYDDFGVAPGIVSIEGLIVGDDYRAKAFALEAAFKMPGPGTLIHPWLGPMTVMLERPGSISFSDRELRVLRFSVAFKRIEPSFGFSIGGLSGLISSIATVISAASALATVVGTLIISASRGKAVTRSTRIVTAAIDNLTAPAGARRFLPRLKVAVATAPSTPAAFNALMVTTAALFGEADDSAAVAPAAEAVTEPSPSPLSLMAMAMTLVEGLSSQAKSAPSIADRALLASAAIHYLAQAATQSSYAAYPSRREALAFRARTTDAIDGLLEVLEAFSGSVLEASADSLRRSARQLQAAVIADINEVIGRLPDVLTFRPSLNLDAWLLAAHVWGDKPELMEAGYRDIVARNNPRHPAALPAGDIEVLA